VSPEGQIPVGVRLVNLKPNPMRGMTSISFWLPSAGRVRVTIHDVQGRLVRELVNEYRRASVHHTVWDGTDMRGHPVSGGLYFIVVEAEKHRTAGKVVLIR
jgi:flagellar hook assembly protein FlgD